MLKTIKKVPFATITTLLIACIIITGCSGNNAGVNVQSNGKIIKISIFNKTALRTLKKNKDVTDRKDIETVANELNAMKPMSDVSLTRSFGYYEAILFYDNGKMDEYDVNYTVHDGVVIANAFSHHMYRNDKLEELMITNLNKF